MVHISWVFLGFVCGGIMGVAAMSIFSMGAKNDD